jgi:hypothetical protein
MAIFLGWAEAFACQFPGVGETGAVTVRWRATLPPGTRNPVNSGKLYCTVTTVVLPLVDTVTWFAARAGLSVAPSETAADTAALAGETEDGTQEEPLA